MRCHEYSNSKTSPADLDCCSWVDDIKAANLVCAADNMSELHNESGEEERESPYRKLWLLSPTDLYATT